MPLDDDFSKLLSYRSWSSLVAARMAGPAKEGDRRMFRPASVGKCYAQTANDRFGKKASELLLARQTASSAFGEDPDEDPQWSILGPIVPRMQKYRNNLTALSQVYNLYLVAYQGEIHVYVPRCILRQTLPSRPDACLQPCAGKVSRHIGGYQDRKNPHIINHIVVGMLGRKEVVVACFDDGDVVAYWTRQIADYVVGRAADLGSTPPPVLSGPRTASRLSKPEPLLHDNVGRSAWGLAVHKKSRLIAVSSNRCEVTVFAFGLAPRGKRGRKADTCDCCYPFCEHVESHVRRRARNWRIVVTLGHMASNLPNLCFVDDERGSADIICAMDVNGVVWLAHIWDRCQVAVCLARKRPGRYSHFSTNWDMPNVGWGVVALPKSDFLLVDSFEELVGASSPVKLRQLEAILDMQHHVLNMPDNPCPSGGNGISSLFVNSLMSAQEGVSSPSPNPFGSYGDVDSEQSDYEESDDSMMEEIMADEVMMDAVVAANMAQSGETAAGPGNSETVGPQNIEMADPSEGTEGDNGPEPLTDGGDAMELEEDDMFYPDTAAGLVASYPEYTAAQGEDALASESANMTGGPADEEAMMAEALAVQLAAAASDPDFYSDATIGPPPPFLISGEGLGFSPMMMPTQPLHQPLPSLLPPPPPPLLPLPPPHSGRSKRSRPPHWVEAAAHAPSPHETTEKMGRLDMIYYPHKGMSLTMPQDAGNMVRFLQSSPMSNNLGYNEKNREGVALTTAKVSERYRLLRLYDADMELQSLEKEGSGGNSGGGAEGREPLMLWRSMLNHGGPGPTPGLFKATNRLSMVVRVPELWLLVVGSASGRVLLVTPTRLAEPMRRKQWQVQHGMRVDWVLPRRSDERVHREKRWPLHGMAIGPVQERRVGRGGGGGRGGVDVDDDDDDDDDEIDYGRFGWGYLGRRGGNGPRRYRLMLHYQNHDVLTYEISREVDTGRVCIY